MRGVGSRRPYPEQVIGRLHHLALRVYRRLPVRARRGVVRAVAPGYSVGAVCVIQHQDGSLLLVRQSYRNGWGVPGGLLKRRERPTDAARREVLEEVGLDIVLMGEPAVVVEPSAHRVDIIFRARVADGQDPSAVRARSPEISEVGWFRAGSMPELQVETRGALAAMARSAPAGPEASHIDLLQAP